MTTRVFLLTTALMAGTIAIGQAQSPNSQNSSERQATSPSVRQIDTSAAAARNSTTGTAGQSDSNRSDVAGSTTGTSSTSGTATDQSPDRSRSSDNAHSPSQDRRSNDNAQAPRDRANDNAQSRDRTNNRDAERSDSKRDARDSADRDTRGGTNTSRSDSDRPAANQQSERGRDAGMDRTRTSTNVDVNININSQQRTRINQSIARLDVRPVTNVNFSVSVGTVVPRKVRLRTLPSDVVEIVPQYRGYSFFAVRDEIVIVEPSSNKIVTVIARGGGGRAEAAPRQRTTFTETDRAAVRKYSRRSEPRTTGSAVRSSRITVGERIPAGVELQSFPDDVYVDAPALREYRYIQQENRTYVIEPHERTIIEEID